MSSGVSQSAQRPVMAFGHVQTRDQIGSKLVEVLLGCLHCQAATNHQDVAAVTGHWSAKIFPGLSVIMCISCFLENPGYGSNVEGTILKYSDYSNFIFPQCIAKGSRVYVGSCKTTPF